MGLSSIHTVVALCWGVTVAWEEGAHNSTTACSLLLRSEQRTPPRTRNSTTGHKDPHLG